MFSASDKVSLNIASSLAMINYRIPVQQKNFGKYIHINSLKTRKTNWQIKQLRIKIFVYLLFTINVKWKKKPYR